jgi:hypothetical protein
MWLQENLKLPVWPAFVACITCLLDSAELRVRVIEESKIAVRVGIRNPKVCNSRNHLEMLDLHLGNSECF